MQINVKLDDFKQLHQNDWTPGVLQGLEHFDEVSLVAHHFFVLTIVRSVDEVRVLVSGIFNFEV